MNVVVIGSGTDITATRGDNARGHRAAEPERIADRDNPVADPRLVGGAEIDCRQLLVSRIDFQQGQVRFLVLADDLGVELFAIVQDHGHLVRAFDDVIVGNDQPRLIDNETRSQGRDAARGLITAGPAVEAVEKITEGRAFRELELRAFVRLALALDLLRRRDIDDRRQQALDQIGETVGCAPRVGRNRLPYQQRRHRDNKQPAQRRRAAQTNRMQ